MKKSVLYIFLIGVMVSSCTRKDDSVFTETPDQRLNKILTDFQTTLTSSAIGWNASLVTGKGSIYHFYFRFNESNRTFMFGDINGESASVLKESSYRLKALQQPALIFDTYNYLHLLSDPDPNVNGGELAVGFASDFEFALDSLGADVIKLTGRVNGSKMILTRASQANLDDWQNGNWGKGLLFENVTQILNYFKRLNVGGTNYEMRVDPTARTITFTWIDGSGNAQQFITGYSYNVTSLVLTNPLVTNSQTISTIDILSWNSSTSVINVSVNGTASSISGAIKPLKTDIAAPARWWQDAITNGNTPWLSGGFHANGLDDAFGINALPQFYALIYWPDYGSGNDLFSPVFNENGSLTIEYGAAPDKPQFTGDGRAIFTLLGYYGTYPTTGPAALSLTQLLIPEGYYFVQTSTTSYDMVSAVDAKTWISWQ